MKRIVLFLKVVQAFNNASADRPRRNYYQHLQQKAGTAGYPGSAWHALYEAARDHYEHMVNNKPLPPLHT